MFGLKKGRNQNIVMLLAVAALIFLLFQMNSKSGYAIVEREYSAFGAAPAAGPAAGPAPAAASGFSAVCEMANFSTSFSRDAVLAMLAIAGCVCVFTCVCVCVSLNVFEIF